MFRFRVNIWTVVLHSWCLLWPTFTYIVPTQIQQLSRTQWHSKDLLQENEYFLGKMLSTISNWSLWKTFFFVCRSDTSSLHVCSDVLFPKTTYILATTKHIFNHFWDISFFLQSLLPECSQRESTIRRDSRQECMASLISPALFYKKGLCYAPSYSQWYFQQCVLRLCYVRGPRRQLYYSPRVRFGFGY